MHSYKNLGILHFFPMVKFCADNFTNLTYHKLQIHVKDTCKLNQFVSTANRQSYSLKKHG